MKNARRDHKKKPGKSLLALLLAAALVVGGMTTAFATEKDADTAAAQDAQDGAAVNTDKLAATVEDGAADPQGEEASDPAEDAAGSVTGVYDIATDTAVSEIAAEKAGETDALVEEDLSDDDADVETKAQWEATLPGDLTGVWADDLISVAKSQLDYAESAENYRADEAGVHKGYTRYGAWYGDPYGDWSALFADFCLHYAKIPDEAFPQGVDCPAWVKELDEAGMYESADDGYTPVPGDLIFLATDSEDDADHVGIVTDVRADAESFTVTVIEGDARDADAGDDTPDAVRETEYEAADEQIAGYGILPENPETAEEVKESEKEMETEEESAARIEAAVTDKEDILDDETIAGAYTGGEVSTLSAVTAPSGAWYIDDYYVSESDQYDVTKTDDFSLKYQVEFHTDEDLEAGVVTITIDASLGTYRNGENILPTDIGVPYGTPGNYTESRSSSFNYYYIDESGNILTEEQAKTAKGVQIVIWNYEEIKEGSTSVLQVLYGDMDVMQIPDETSWDLSVDAKVSDESVSANSLSGDVDTEVKVNSVTKKAYTASSKSYTPELYTTSQVNSYINGTIGEPYKSNFDDYVYMVWQVTLSGTTTQAFTIAVDDATVADGAGGSVVGYRLYSSSGLSTQYGTSDNPAITFTSGTSRSYTATFYVVTACEKDSYTEGDTIDNTVTVTAQPADGVDANVVKDASASSSWDAYDWHYTGNTISTNKYTGTSGTTTTKTYNAYETLYEINQGNGLDTGEFSYRAVSTTRDYSYTHYTDGVNLGEWITGSYYKTTTVDDALYVQANGVGSTERMLGKDDYYFSSVTVSTSDTGYDVWEDTTATAESYDGIDQALYVYAMFYEEGADADADGWELVATVPFSTGTMRYAFTDDDLARQPYRVKAVHDTANYSTDTSITLGVTLRHDSPVIEELQDENDVDSLVIANLSGIAVQIYNDDNDGTYLQNTTSSGSVYGRSDTKSGETLAQFTEALYGTILQRNSATSTLTALDETASANKSVELENDTANARVLANYYLTAYESYYVTGSSTVDALEEAGFALPSRHEVAYYDLLPYGMQFNANASVTAGRITSMNSSGTWKTNTGAWSKTDVSVTVGEDDVITNWHDTGRTMVVFHITYDGDDASAFYDVPSSDKDLWYQGFGIAFQAYYDWTETQIVDAEYNIAAYITSDESEFLGARGSEVYKDDGSANLSSQYEPFEGVSDLNGDGVTDKYTNMYCSVETSTNVATASSDAITKTVRADDDAVAEYGKTAVVSEGRDYTYEITLKNTTGSTLSDVVLFDRLEYAVEDGRATAETGSDSVYAGLTTSEIDNHWTGTYAGITTSALSDIGIAPVVYYSANRNATVTSGTTTPSEVLTEANGWYTESAFLSQYGDLSQVAAVAVDISKDTNGNPFTMDQDTNVSFMIHMTAPEEGAYGSEYLYAFNNPLYYRTSTDAVGTETRETSAGASTRVELGEAGTIEVEKVTAGDVPGEMANANFTFTLKRGDTPLSNIEYMTYTSDDGDWVSTGVVSATDVNGQFTIKADQKAVFSKLTNIENVTVTEDESVFWVSEVEKKEITSDNEVDYTYTNTYRSPVYLYKTVATTDLADEDTLDNAAFTFQLLVSDGNGGYTPYANGEYLYVTEALTDGSSPTIDTTKGVAGHGYTDANGYVTLTLSDIIAFYPTDGDGNTIDVAYEIAESDLSADGDWVCFDSEATGTTSAYGTKATITNYYKYRSITLTKDLSDYDHDIDACTDEWTFTLTDASGSAVAGAHWYMIDASGNATGTEGVTASDGTFTFTGAGSGHRVVIEDLIEGESYTLTETGYDTTLYEPVNGGTVEAAMPVYSTNRAVTVTNKWLPKDLSVSKIALSDSADVTTRAFTFTLKDGNDNVVAGAAYTIENGDGTVYTTDASGRFTLTGGQRAVFDDIGYMGDAYVVTETPDTDYSQIYPANGADGTATLTSDGGSIRFVNGDFEDVASFTKELNGLDATGEAYTDIVKNDSQEKTIQHPENYEAFAIYSEDDYSLTFYYDNLLDVGSQYKGKTVTELYTGLEDADYSSYSSVPWYSYRETVTNVVIDRSFRYASPISLAYWFYNFTNADFTGLEYIDTSSVTTLEYTFYGCSGLTNVDGLASWDTSKVTTLHGTFARCFSLTNVGGLLKWDTSRVTTLFYTFAYCSSLVNIDGLANWNISCVTVMTQTFEACPLTNVNAIENWDVSNVTSFTDTFQECTELANVDAIINWDLSSATHLTNMFYKCTNLTQIDVSKWHTVNVFNMGHMFEGCSALTTIYSDDDVFATDAVTTGSSVFSSCTKLVGGNGTKYDSSNTSYTMAHVDTASNPGYFTDVSAKPLSASAREENVKQAGTRNLVRALAESPALLTAADGIDSAENGLDSADTPAVLAATNTDDPAESDTSSADTPSFLSVTDENDPTESGVYSVEATIGVYDSDGKIVTSNKGTLTDYTGEGPYTLIYISQGGEIELYDYNGGAIDLTIYPYDYVYVAGLSDGKTLNVTESDSLTRIIYATMDDVTGKIGSNAILSEGAVMSGSAAANEDVTLVNNISSANAPSADTPEPGGDVPYYHASEIYKVMSDASDDVPTGSEITFCVEVYNAASGTWSPASGIRYITFEGYEGGYDTEDALPTSSVMTTGSDGKITLTKTDSGYPFIRFIENTVYANVYTDMEDGQLRIVEMASGTDDAWGLLSGYDADGWVGGPALTIGYADTFVDANDDGLVFEVEKEMLEDEVDAEFTFHVVQILSAEASPITSMSEINETAVGAGLYYIAYDAETGQVVSDGYTDSDGCLTIRDGQYARIYAPEGTTWYVYEGTNPGYPLYGVEANSDTAANASIVDEVNGVVQETTNPFATHTITLTLTDEESGAVLSGGVFTLYKDGSVYESGLTTNRNGQIIVSGLSEGAYYFVETEAPSGYELPDADETQADTVVTIPSGLNRATVYTVGTTNESLMAVRYAVKLWGICADTYSYDEGATTRLAGLTFGPATGADYLTSSVSCDSDTCIHKLSWDEIISYCKESSQEELNALFGSCLENGCTKSVKLTPNETLFNMTTVDNYLNNTSYTGDGVGTLYYLLNGTGSASVNYGGIWNVSQSSTFDYTDPSNVYSRSRIRTMLTGDRKNIEEWMSDSSHTDYYGMDSLCDETNCLLTCFPEELQSAVVPRTTENTGNATQGTSINDVTTYDKLFLFSNKEVTGGNDSSYGYDDGGGNVYNVENAWMLFEFANTSASGSGSYDWWSRSRYSYRTSEALLANFTNDPDDDVNFPHGISPGFCLPGPASGTITR